MSVIDHSSLVQQTMVAANISYFVEKRVREELPNVVIEGDMMSCTEEEGNRITEIFREVCEDYGVKND